MRHLSPSTVLRGTVAAVLLAVGMCLSAGRAEAGCGDYLKLLGEPGTHDSQLAARLMNSGHLPPEPGRSDRPCRGPNCSSAPSAPDMPVPVPPVGKDTAAGMHGEVDDHAAASRRTAWLDSAARRIHRPTDTFRPPRSV
ncbi:MAG: hypothetical protein U0736_21540 [Gemmataceae bacterium]